MSKEINKASNLTQDEPVKPVFGASGRKIVYDKDGKPCRTCNTLLDFRMASVNDSAKSGSGIPGIGAITSGAVIASKVENDKRECPPDVEQLGRSSWVLLHSIAAAYPEKPSEQQQDDMSSFINIFSKIYPCWFCAEDFRNYIASDKPKVKTQEDFGRWLCDAHNAVNVKLGKPEFDCNLWKQRWKDGYKDGKCN